MIVLKFGGTSVANSISMTQTGKVVSNQINLKPIVILSACSGITNKLIQVTQLSANHGFEHAKYLYDEIYSHHINLINELIIDNYHKNSALNKSNLLLNKLQEILTGIGLLNENSPQMADEVLSFGELLSSTIFNIYLNSIGIKSKFIESSSVIKTNSNFNSAIVDFDLTNKLLNESILHLFSEYDVIVSQGFIGSNKQNKITTLGRGGSDYSASVFAAGLNADEIQIWTDVSGVMTADPNLLTNVKTIPFMTADEISSLSFFGAKVLHPLTIVPAMQKNIPVKVLNTFAPDSEFTTILNKISESYKLNSLILKKDCLQFEIDSTFQQSTIIQKRFVDTNFNILNTVYQNGKLYLLTDKSDNIDLLQDFEFNVKKSDLIIICGNNLNKTKILDIRQFFEFDAINDVQIQIYNHSNNAIIFAVESKFSIILAHHFHDIILEFQN